MGDLPLRTPTDRGLGGPLPRQQPNQTHPHRKAVNLYCNSDVLITAHRALILLSQGCALLCGRLDTRYSPIRRSSPSKSKLSQQKQAFAVVTPRLACVKPVASVHPEPGSNSPLYNIFIDPKAYISLSESGTFVLLRSDNLLSFSTHPAHYI